MARMGTRRRVLVAAATVSAATMALVAPAFAQPSSTVGTDASAYTIDLTDVDGDGVSIPANDTATVVAGLPEETCPSSLDNGLTYGLVATGPAFVSIAPASVSGLHCGDTATFVVSAVTTATPPYSGTQAGTLTFTPVVASTGSSNPHGVQDQLSAGLATITVVFPASDCTDCDDGVDPGSPAAAPAIANAYINENVANSTGLAAACQKKAKNKSNWRGTVISYIAQDPSLMPGWVRFSEQYGVVAEDPDTWGTWTKAVEDEVNSFCAYTPSG